MPARDKTYQERIHEWMLECFGPAIAADLQERGYRFLEEALELVQVSNVSRTDAHKLVDYVYDREEGEPFQEVGGVLVCLASLCTARQLDMNECGEKELARVWSKIDAIRAKHASKPIKSPLPGKYPN